MATDSHRRRVKEVMARDVVYVDPQDTIEEALALLIENRVSALPVVNGRQQCVGVLSTTDLIGLARELGDEVADLSQVSEASRGWLLEKMEQHGMTKQKVREVMTTEVVSTGPEATLAQAARAMVRNRVHRLAVVDDNRLVGILSTMDILEAFAADGEK
jgi:CBS domain-containing protein